MNNACLVRIGLILSGNAATIIESIDNVADWDHRNQSRLFEPIPSKVQQSN